MIVTFYSFKGGVGRSMALANIGRWFQMCGLNVVTIDWDLEAPGLESFYLTPGPSAEGARDQLGLIDLLNLYKQVHPNLGFDLTREPGSRALKQDPQADLQRLRERLPPMLHALIDLPPPAVPLSYANAVMSTKVQPGSLKLLCAGWRSGDRFATYANAVQAFDWNDFYLSFHGRAYFEWLRESLCRPEVADIVLIDSRTGVTEMGGVCTRQMADAVVVLTAPNRQNIDGATRMADSFCRDDVLRERGGRTLELIMVPSRVDVSSSDVKVAFEQEFRRQAERFVPKEFEHLGRDFWDLRIPYIAKYAFMEKLAVGESDGDPDILAAYKAIAAHIAWLAPEESRIKQVMRPEFERVFGAEQTRLYLASDRFFAHAIAMLDARELDRARRILTRLVQVAAEEPGTRDTSRLVAPESFDAEHRRTVEQLISLGLIRPSDGKRSLIGLCNDDFVTRSQLKSWIDEDRAFLLWRQKLRSYMDDWEASQHDPAALLQGSIYETAQRMRESRPAADLFEDEADFIERSGEELRRQQDAQLLQTRQLEEAQATVLAHVPAAASASAGAARPAVRPSRAWWGAVAGGVVIAVTATWGLNYFRRPAPPVTTATQVAQVAPAATLKVQDLIKQGQAQAAGGDAAEARKSFAQALALDPRSRDARLGQARALKAGGDTKGALAELDAIVKLVPNDAEALLERANVYSELGDPAAALKDFDRIAAAGATTPSVLVRRGKMLESLGDDRAAEASYDDAIKLSGGQNAEALFARGALYERTGQRTSAARDFGAVNRLPGDDLTRTAAQARLKRLAPPPKPSESVTASLPTATRHVVIAVSNADDRSVAQEVSAALRRSGLQSVVAAEPVKAGPRVGMLRYFSSADAGTAAEVRSAVESALASTGYKTPLRLQLQEGQGKPGRFVVTLPSLNSPAGSAWDTPPGGK